VADKDKHDELVVDKEEEDEGNWAYEEEEGAGEEEYEWEYYDEEEVDEEEKEEDEEEVLPKRKSPASVDENEPWMAEGLANLMPAPPKRKPFMDMSEEEEEEEEDNEEGEEDEDTHGRERRRSKELGYTEWLEANAAALRQNTLDDLLTDEEAEQGEGDNNQEEIPEVTKKVEEEVTADETLVQPPTEKVSKAMRLVDKMKRATGADLKRILFSLKSAFQVIFKAIKAILLILMLTLVC